MQLPRKPAADPSCEFNHVESRDVHQRRPARMAPAVVAVASVAVRLAVGRLMAVVAALSPAPAATSPCPVPARLGDGWETIGAADAHMDADALCKLLHTVAGGPDNLHSLLVARGGHIVAELYRKGRDRSARD